MAAMPIIRHIEPEELRRLGREQTSGRMASRMFAIANVLDGLSREDAATHAGMERQCLRDWVHRFNAEPTSRLIKPFGPARPGVWHVICACDRNGERVEFGRDQDKAVIADLLSVNGVGQNQPGRYRRMDDQRQKKAWANQRCSPSQWRSGFQT